MLMMMEQKVLLVMDETKKKQGGSMRIIERLDSEGNILSRCVTKINYKEKVYFLTAVLLELKSITFASAVGSVGIKVIVPIAVTI